MLTNAPRGTKDILPDAVGAWTHVEHVIRDLCARYGYGEIRTPMFEHTELFQRGIGDGTDVVDKEMYTFSDRGDRSLPRTRRLPCAPICKTNSMRTAAYRSSSTSDRCFAMTARRQGGCVSFISSAWRRSARRALRWMPRSSSSRMIF